MSLLHSSSIERTFYHICCYLHFLKAVQWNSTPLSAVSSPAPWGSCTCERKVKTKLVKTFKSNEWNLRSESGDHGSIWTGCLPPHLAPRPIPGFVDSLVSVTEADPVSARAVTIVTGLLVTQPQTLYSFLRGSPRPRFPISPCPLFWNQYLVIWALQSDGIESCVVSTSLFSLNPQPHSNHVMAWCTGLPIPPCALVGENGCYNDGAGAAVTRVSANDAVVRAAHQAIRAVVVRETATICFPINTFT